MISWQARLMTAYFRAQRVFSAANAELDVAADRAQGEAFAKTFKPFAEVKTTPVNAGGVAGRWIIPSGTLTERVILFTHGGSYNSGSSASHLPLTANIALAAQARALSIDYRLAPEHPFPAAVEDALAAYRWLLAENVPPSQVILAGDSAGGGLVLALLISLRDANLPLPALGICLSPWTDLACSGESWKSNAHADIMLDTVKLAKSARLYLADTDSRSPLASPLYADLTGLPPLLIQVGSDEILLSDSTRLAEKAKAAGVDVTLDVWDKMQHEWQYAARLLPEGRRAIQRIGEFISQRDPNRA